MLLDYGHSWIASPSDYVVRTFSCFPLGRTRTCVELGWDSKLDAVTELKVGQRTPLRVAHRRTGIVREKVIHSMSSEIISSRIFILDMDTSAGTYVKEFVHGDLGTTHHLFAFTLARGVCQFSA
eukprot:COSAG02_NODE_4938_length_4811_cov_23.006791_2_plen_124_part_00